MAIHVGEKIERKRWVRLMQRGNTHQQQNIAIGSRDGGPDGRSGTKREEGTRKQKRRGQRASIDFRKRRRLYYKGKGNSNQQKGGKGQRDLRLMGTGDKKQQKSKDQGDRREPVALIRPG